LLGGGKAVQKGRVRISLVQNFGKWGVGPGGVTGGGKNCKRKHQKGLIELKISPKQQFRLKKKAKNKPSGTTSDMEKRHQRCEGLSTT